LYRIAAPNAAANDDVNNWVTHRIFNINYLDYLVLILYSIVDQTSSVAGGF